MTVSHLSYFYPSQPRRNWQQICLPSSYLGLTAGLALSMITSPVKYLDGHRMPARLLPTGQLFWISLLSTLPVPRKPPEQITEDLLTALGDGMCAYVS